jgi:leader peptidase (prepilin peptidase) / N-methyltransferase
MTILAEHQDTPSLRPNFAILAAGTGAAALLSFASLPWPLALASSLLGLLMVAGADVDARTFLLPDAVTYGAILCGIAAAPLLEAADPWQSLGPWQSLALASLRAAGTGLALYLLRLAYARLRKTEGLGLGDVKLAAASGAWLALDAIPICFGMAAAAALTFVLIQGQKQSRAEPKLPFGAFLCPALWLSFFVASLPR